MDPRVVARLSLLMLFSILCLEARVESSRSVFFMDGSSQRYIRNPPLDGTGEINSMSSDEVAATISVLLGFAPPSSLPADSSSKLDEILLPNPFDRPRAVFMLEVKGIADPLLSIDFSNSQVGSIFKSRVLDSAKAEIQHLGEDEVSVIPLDEPLIVDCDAACFDKELSNLAQWLGGSYVGSLESIDGELTIPLASGSTLNLHVAKKAELEFLSNLAGLIKNIKKAMEIHEDFYRSIVNPAELMIGQFLGIEALVKEYGSQGIASEGVELFQTVVIKLFNSLQEAYEGKIVGVVILNKDSSPDMGAMIDVTYSPRVSRLLKESISNTTISEVILVRRSLAWMTGIILLVSTLIGVCFLFNMPLTRDSLLYSNVKLD